MNNSSKQAIMRLLSASDSYIAGENEKTDQSENALLNDIYLASSALRETTRDSDPVEDPDPYDVLQEFVTDIDGVGRAALLDENGSNWWPDLVPTYDRALAVLGIHPTPPPAP